MIYNTSTPTAQPESQTVTNTPVDSIEETSRNEKRYLKGVIMHNEANETDHHMVSNEKRNCSRVIRSEAAPMSENVRMLLNEANEFLARNPDCKLTVHVREYALELTR